MTRRGSSGKNHRIYIHINIVDLVERVIWYIIMISQLMLQCTNDVGSGGGGENKTLLVENITLTLLDGIYRILTFTYLKNYLKFIRNKVKYNQSRIVDQTIFNTWKNNLKKHLQCTHITNFAY